MAQIPNLDNAPINITSIRFVDYHFRQSTFIFSKFCIYIRINFISPLYFAVKFRDQSQKELINLLKNVSSFP